MNKTILLVPGNNSLSHIAKCFFIIVVSMAMFLLSSCSSIDRKDSSKENGLVPLLTFVFDDGNDTDYLITRDVFKEHNATASFAVVTGWINKRNYLTEKQLLELQKDGFEIMSHTVSHPNLRSLNADQIESELSVSKATLEGWGLRVNNLVYPYNKNNGRVRELVGKYYRSARGGRNILNPAVPDRYELKSYSLSHNTMRMKELIDMAATEGKWLIIYMHNMNIQVKASQRNSDFQLGEDLLFSPSGAMGRYSSELFSWFRFVPMSGAPRAGDIITGQSSKATCHLDEIIYNEREDIGELIEYTQSSYPDMKIVTIDQGLDIYGIK